MGGTLAQRVDDEPTTIRHRLDVYKRLTRPLVDFYRERDLLTEIDASVGSEVVREEVLEFDSRCSALIVIKNKEELAGMRRAGAQTGQILHEVVSKVAPGVTQPN